MDNKILMLFIVILLMGISSCSEDVAFQETVDLEGKWPANKKLIFEFDIDDTASNYMLIYTIRNSIDYPYYNLYVKYSIKDTLGRKIDENLQELMLMDKKTGRPLGQGFGQMNDHSFISKKDFHFPYNGKYYFNVIQFMRHDTLPEIYSVGLKVVKSDIQTH